MPRQRHRRWSPVRNARQRKSPHKQDHGSISGPLNRLDRRVSNRRGQVFPHHTASPLRLRRSLSQSHAEGDAVAVNRYRENLHPTVMALYENIKLSTVRLQTELETLTANVSELAPNNDHMKWEIPQGMVCYIECPPSPNNEVIHGGPASANVAPALPRGVPHPSFGDSSMRQVQNRQGLLTNGADNPQSDRFRASGRRSGAGPTSFRIRAVRNNSTSQTDCSMMRPQLPPQQSAFPLTTNISCPHNPPLQEAAADSTNGISAPGFPIPNRITCTSTDNSNKNQIHPLPATTIPFYQDPRVIQSDMQRQREQQQQQYHHSQHLHPQFNIFHHLPPSSLSLTSAAAATAEGSSSSVPYNPTMNPNQSRSACDQRSTNPHNTNINTDTDTDMNQVQNPEFKEHQNQNTNHMSISNILTDDTNTNPDANLANLDLNPINMNTTMDIDMDTNNNNNNNNNNPYYLTSNTNSNLDGNGEGDGDINIKSPTMTTTTTNSNSDEHDVNHSYSYMSW